MATPGINHASDSLGHHRWMLTTGVFRERVWGVSLSDVALGSYRRSPCSEARISPGSYRRCSSLLARRRAVKPGR